MKPIQCKKCNMYYDSEKYDDCPFCNKEKKLKRAKSELHENKSSNNIMSHKQNSILKMFTKKKTESEVDDHLEVESNVVYNDVHTANKVEEKESSHEKSNEIINTDETLKEEKTTLSLQEEVKKSQKYDDQKTVAFYDFGNNNDPVVGWLVCLKGQYVGGSFNIVSGRNTIGRSLTNSIAFAKEKTISREKHASIVFEPNKKEFFIQPGESSGLTYLNDELIMSFKPLKDRDVIELGSAKFMFVQLCSKEFSWDDNI